MRIEILSPHVIKIDYKKASKTKLLRIPVIGTDMPISKISYYKRNVALHMHLATFFAHQILHLNVQSTFKLKSYIYTCLI